METEKTDLEAEHDAKCAGHKHSLIYAPPGYGYVVLKRSTLRNAGIFPTYWDAMKFRLWRPFTDLTIRLIYVEGSWISAFEAVDEDSTDFQRRVEFAGIPKPCEGYAQAGRALFQFVVGLAKSGEKATISARGLEMEKKPE